MEKTNLVIRLYVVVAVVGVLQAIASGFGVVDPPNIELYPGETGINYLNVQNRAGATEAVDVRMTITWNDVNVASFQGGVQQIEFTLDAETEIDVPMTVTVPRDAEIGHAYQVSYFTQELCGGMFCIGMTSTFHVMVKAPSISIPDVSLPEGDTGATSFEFLVHLSPAIGSIVTVDYATTDGSATVVDNDYLPTSGTLFFDPNEATKIIHVFVNGDKIREFDETFFLFLENPSNAVLTTHHQATSTIINDDCNGPGFPYNLTPPHLASNVNLDLTLHWSCSHPQGKEIKYDLLFGDAAWPIARLANGISNPSYRLPLLWAGRTYAWKIIATDGNNVTEGPKSLFKTRSQKHDLNYDGIVNLIDFAILAQEYLEAPSEANVPRMVYIYGGEFEMGDSKNEGSSAELPVHLVKIDSFYMGTYEVTNEQYCQFLNSALGSSIYVSGGIVYGIGNDLPYCDTSTSNTYSQISYSGGVLSGAFSVRNKGGRNMSDDPMVMVRWYGSAAYCNWRSQEEGMEQCYNLSNWNCDFNTKGYRLPTEAEWEYAARGNVAGQRFLWGDTISQTQANFRSDYYLYDVSPEKNIYHPLWSDLTYPFTSPVGFFDGSIKYKTDYQWPGSDISYQTTSGANNYGLYDMAGNVCEWCNDWYSEYSSDPQINPTGPASGSWRVFRGGSFKSGAERSRCAARDLTSPGDCGHNLGFRVVLDLQ